MSSGATRAMVELTALGPDDRNAQHAAAVLAAYFQAEHARAFRLRLWRRLAVAAIVASLLKMMTPLLPGTGLFVALTALAAAAAAAAVAEWRAENTLRRLVASRAVRTAERDAVDIVAAGERRGDSWLHGFLVRSRTWPVRLAHELILASLVQRDDFRFAHLLLPGDEQHRVEPLDCEGL